MPSQIGKTILGQKDWEKLLQKNKHDSTVQQQLQQINVPSQPITLSFCHQLRYDQMLVVNYLNQGHDVFQLVGAGGGKTLPVICWWVTNCLGVNVINPHEYRIDFSKVRKLIDYKSIPKLIWCVPTRQLSTRFVTDEFKQPIASLISIIINNLVRAMNPQDVIKLLSIIGVKNAANRIMELGQLQNAVETTNNPVYIQQLESKLANLQTEVTKAVSSIVDSYITMAMEGVVPNLDAPVIIGIYESIAPRIDKIKNIKLVVFDESHKAVPPDINSLQGELQREFSIADAIFEIVRSLSKNQRLVFLSGTINPSTVDALTHVLNVCFKRNFVTHTSSAKNPAKINVIKDDHLKDSEYLVRLLIQKIVRRDWGNLVVMFSKKQIISICKRIYEDLSISTYQPKKNMYKHQQRSQSDKTGLVQKIIEDPQISQIENSDLRKYALKGFGFITSELSPNDQAIIGSLFANKKLAVLITTDSVEVGVNLAVKNMYIPTIKVFRDNEFKELPLTNLNQLINRAGRSAIDFATIYTTSDFYEKIQSALILIPSKYDPVPLLMNKIDYATCRVKLKLYYARMIVDKIASRLIQDASQMKKYINTVKQIISSIGYSTHISQ